MSRAHLEEYGDQIRFTYAKPCTAVLIIKVSWCSSCSYLTAMQGVFCGFKDTQSPSYATWAGDTTNIVLDPIFIFVFRLGLSAAAIGHVLSQFSAFDESHCCHILCDAGSKSGADTSGFISGLLAG